MLPDDRPAVEIKDWQSPYSWDATSLDPTKLLEWDARSRIWYAARPNGDGTMEIPDGTVLEHIDRMMHAGQTRTEATHKARSVEYWYNGSY